MKKRKKTKSYVKKKINKATKIQHVIVTDWTAHIAMCGNEERKNVKMLITINTWQ
jgi:hypothetical protein